MRNRFRIFQIESCTINAIYSLPVHVDERARNRRYIVSQGIFGPISTKFAPPHKKILRTGLHLYSLSAL